jgi:hypothetical protein
MIPLCVSEDDIKADDLQLLTRVRLMLFWLPSGLSCHEVCKKVSEAESETRIVRGSFMRADHSWLIIKNRPSLILDPYPWATASGPWLITLEGALNPWRLIYAPLPWDSWELGTGLV